MTWSKVRYTPRFDTARHSCVLIKTELESGWFLSSYDGKQAELGRDCTQCSVVSTAVPMRTAFLFQDPESTPSPRYQLQGMHERLPVPKERFQFTGADRNPRSWLRMPRRLSGKYHSAKSSFRGKHHFWQWDQPPLLRWVPFCCQEKENSLN